MPFVCYPDLEKDFLPWFNKVSHVLLVEEEENCGESSDEQVERVDDVLMRRVPVLVLYLTAAYVTGSLIIPSLVNHGTSGAPAYPIDTAFFWFNAVSLVINFYFFTTAFLIVQSHTWILAICKIASQYLLGRDHGMTLSKFLCWYMCLTKVFKFFKEAYRIFALKQNNVRTMQSFYHVLTQLLTPWADMASPDHIMKPLSIIHGLFDATISFYLMFEPQITRYFRAKASNIQYYIALFEIWQHLFVLYEAYEVLDKCDNVMKFWVYSYCSLCMAILSYIIATGIDSEEQEPNHVAQVEGVSLVPMNI